MDITQYVKNQEALKKSTLAQQGVSFDLDPNSEEALKYNPQWINDSKLIYKNETGKRFKGTDREAAEWGLGKQSKIGWNLTSAGLNAFEAQDWAPNVKEAWVRSLESYNNTDPTWRSASRAAFWSIFDLPTLATFGWGAVAKAIGGRAASLSTRYSFKEALKKSLREEAKDRIGPAPAGTQITDKAITQAIAELPEAQIKKIRKEVAHQVAYRTALEQGAGIGAVYTGLYDIAAQDLEGDVDPRKSDFDYKRFAANVFGGLVLGGGVGYGIPRAVEKFGRGKFIRDALNQSAEYADEIVLTPNELGLEKGSKLQYRLIKEGKDKKLSENKDTYEVAEQVINKVQKEKGRPANVIDEGTGPVQKIKSKLDKREKETLPNVENLKQKTGANVQGDDLQFNRTQSKQNKYIDQNARGKGDQDVSVISNVAGRYDQNDKILFNSVLKEKIKNLADDGYMVINTGPRKKEAVAVDVFDDEIIPPFERETKGRTKTKDDLFEFEEKPIKDTKGKARKRDKITGLSDNDLGELLAENFKFVGTKNINGRKVFIARNKIKYKPNTKPYTFNKESRFEKIFRFVGLTAPRLQKLKNAFKSSAGLPPALEKFSATKKAAIRAVGVRIKQDFHKLQQAMEKHISVEGVSLKNLTPRKYDEVLETVNNAAFGGDEQAFKALPTQVQEQLMSMRKSISLLRKRLLDKSPKNPEGTGYIKNGTQLHQQIVQQVKNGLKPDMELRINRQYEIFDNPDMWLKKLKEAQEANPTNNPIQKAKQFFIDQLRKSNIKELDDDLVPVALKYRAAIDAQRKGLVGFKYKNVRYNTANTIAEVEEKEADAMIDSFLSKYSTEELKDIDKYGTDLPEISGEAQRIKGTFYKRKEIPAVIRDLMGEYKDPFVNYANTMVKLFQTYENHKFEKAIRKLVIADKNKPDNLKEFPGVSLKRDSAIGKDLGEATSLARSQDVNLPLQDLKADEVIFDAIKQGNELAPLMNQGWKKIMGLQAITRITKTAYTPSAYPRNFVGAMLKTFAAGNLNLANIRTFNKVWKGLRSFTDDEVAAQTEKLTYLDIHGSGAKIGTLREALDDAVNPNWWIDISVMLGRTDRLTATQKARGAAEAVNKRVLDAYQAMDDLWKWFSFENEKGNYRKVLLDKGINPDEVVDRWKTGGGKDVIVTKLDEYAGQMVRAHMDNYGNVAKAFKFARRLPLADFLAYKTEQVRTTWNIFETAIRDIKEGRQLKRDTNGIKGNAQLALGYRRLGSIISAISLPTALATSMAYGYKNMQDDAEITLGGKTYVLPYTKMTGLREAALPDYATGDEYMLIPGAQPKDGKDLRMFNISYLDPWAPLRAPILSLLRGANGLRDLEEGAAKGFKDSSLNLLGSFGASMFSEALFGAAFGLDKFGRPLSKPDDLMPEKGYDRLARFVKAFEPGLVRDLNKVYKSIKFGATERGGFKLEPLGQGFKFVGVPYQYVEPKISLRFKAAPLLKNITNASSSFYEAIGTYNPKSEQGIIDAYKDTLRREYNAADKLARLFIAARSTGMSSTDIYKSITKDGNFPSRFNKNVFNSMVLKGKFIPTTFPVSSNIMALKRHVEQTTNAKVNVSKVMKELLEIYRSYAGEDFTITKSLIEKEKE